MAALIALYSLSLILDASNAVSMPLNSQESSDRRLEDNRELAASIASITSDLGEGMNLTRQTAKVNERHDVNAKIQV